MKKPPPPWLVTERVLGRLGLPPGAGLAYEAYMESRVLELGIKARRRDLEAHWGNLRRGWYVGGEIFGRAYWSGWIKRSPQKGHAPRHRGSHTIRVGRRMLAAGLRALGIRSGDLATLPKGQREKLVLAWWLYGQTTVRRRWVAEQLRMGYETRVSQAVSLVESSREPC